MRLLLDTHALLWALGDVERLRPATRAAIADGAHVVCVSAVSIWEAGIKRALGKLESPGDLVGAIGHALFRELPISAAHAQLAASLPAHHQDPFDRMLVAQARIEELTLVTRDARLADYGVAIMPA